MSRNTPARQQHTEDPNFVFADVADLDLSSFEEFRDEIQYIGFRPQAVAAIVKTHPNWKKDVVQLVNFGLTRGTKLAKAMNKMSDAGKQKMSKLVKEYNIVESTKGKGAEVLSIARIMIAFSPFALKIAYEKELTSIAPLLEEKFLPSAYQFPWAGGLIPTDNNNMRDEYIQWSMGFNRKVSPSRVTSADEVEKFANISVDSTYVINESRKKLLNQILANSDKLDLHAVE